MIADILPAGVVAAESFGPPGDGKLFPGEAAAIATASPGRRAEFAAGRAVARAALASLGAPAGPVLPGQAGEPRWPVGVLGSITHCAGYRACAVTWARGMAAIGIDAEPCRALPDGLLEEVAGAAERAWLTELSAASPGVPWDRVLFCAKEAGYKAWYTRTGQRPALRGMTVQVSTAGAFAAALPSASLTGRWLVSGGLIVTAVTVPC
jgi:enterobactin synthetase component D / holo-[acyl-carrier protein] synthase